MAGSENVGKTKTVDKTVQKFMDKTGRQTDRQTDMGTDRQIDIQTIRHTLLLTDSVKAPVSNRVERMTILCPLRMVFSLNECNLLNLVYSEQCAVQGVACSTVCSVQYRV